MSYLPCSCRRRGTCAVDTPDTGSGVSCRRRTLPLLGHVTCTRTSGPDAPTAKHVHPPQIATQSWIAGFAPVFIVEQNLAGMDGVVQDVPLLCSHCSGIRITHHHTAYRSKTRRHPQKRKYITYRNAARKGPSYGRINVHR